VQFSQQPGGRPPASAPPGCAKCLTVPMAGSGLFRKRSPGAPYPAVHPRQLLAAPPSRGRGRGVSLNTLPGTPCPTADDRTHLRPCCNGGTRAAAPQTISLEADASRRTLPSEHVPRHRAAVHHGHERGLVAGGGRGRGAAGRRGIAARDDRGARVQLQDARLEQRELLGQALDALVAVALEQRQRRAARGRVGAAAAAVGARQAALIGLGLPLPVAPWVTRLRQVILLVVQLERTRRRSAAPRPRRADTQPLWSSTRLARGPGAARAPAVSSQDSARGDW